MPRSRRRNCRGNRLFHAIAKVTLGLTLLSAKLAFYCTWPLIKLSTKFTFVSIYVLLNYITKIKTTTLRYIIYGVIATTLFSVVPHCSQRTIPKPPPPQYTSIFSEIKPLYQDLKHDIWNSFGHWVKPCHNSWISNRLISTGFGHDRSFHSKSRRRGYFSHGYRNFKSNNHGHNEYRFLQPAWYIAMSALSVGAVHLIANSTQENGSRQMHGNEPRQDKDSATRVQLIDGEESKVEDATSNQSNSNSQPHTVVGEIVQPNDTIAPLADIVTSGARNIVIGEPVYPNDMNEHEIDLATRSFYCPCCLSRKPVHDLAHLSRECDHFICRVCARSYILHEIKKGNVNNIVCPSCVAAQEHQDQDDGYNERGIILQREIFMLLSQKEQQMYLAKSLDHAVANNGSLEFCIIPDCDGVSVVEQGTSKVTCCKCTLEWCSSCRIKWHEGKTCEEVKQEKRCIEQERWKELQTKNGWTKCPSCSELVEQIDGCNRMKCRCGVLFCYLCGERLDPTTPYAHFSFEEEGKCDFVSIKR